MSPSTLLLFALAAPLVCVWGNPTRRSGSAILLDTPLIDGHNDLPYNLRSLVKNQLELYDFKANLTTDPVWSCKSCFTDLPRLKAGRVGGQFWVAYVPCSTQYKDAVAMTLEQIDVIKRFVARYPDDLQWATSVSDIRTGIAAGRIASMIGVEGGHSIDSRMGALRLMYEAGARYLTLTHSCNTPWADASPQDDEPKPVIGGLTDFGKRVVLELNRLGMMVDLSHVSAPTMRDALNVTLAPVIFSHSSARAICNVHRNVPDDVLRAVAKNGGVVMVNFYSGFVACGGRRATLEDVVAHVNHIRKVAGVEHVGIGGDYDGVSCMPQGLEDVSKYPALFDRLAANKEGEPVWSDDDLRRLSNGNVLRVMSDVERVRAELKKKGVQPDETWLPGTVDSINNDTMTVCS